MGHRQRASRLRSEGNPAIAVYGNGVLIANGDATPSTGDDTDFGVTPLGVTITKTYTLNNTTGTGPLVVPTINMASGFTLLTALPIVVSAGATGSFQIRADVASLNTFSGNVSITSNALISPYTFAIRVSSLYLDNVAVVGLTDFWPLNESSGTTIEELIANHDGTYVGPTLAQYTPSLVGYACPSWDGSNDYGNIYSAGFASAFNMAKGFISIWFRNLNPSETGSNRFLFRVNRDANNDINFIKTTNANEYRLRYAAGGTIKDILLTMTDTGAVHVLIDYADAASGSYIRIRKNNVEVANQTTGIGTASGSGLLNNATTLGAALTSGALVFNGNLAAFGYKANAASTADDQRRLSGGQ